MSYRRTRALGILVCCVTSALGVRVLGDEPRRPPGDIVCGPRCVQFLLRTHRIPCDLIELIHEIQWPALESGTTLDRIAAALDRRGVKTQLISVPKDSDYVWPHPSIIHIPASESDLGHFAILLPSRKPHEVTLWLGLGGVRTLRLDKFHQVHSGVALVPLNSPNSDGTKAFARQRNWLWCCLAAIVLVATTSFLGFTFLRDRKVRPGLLLSANVSP